MENTKTSGNFKGVPNIGTEATFLTQEAKVKFYQAQLDIVRDIEKGEKTWAYLNEYRKSFGYPDINIDSIRRSFTQLRNYDELGWVRQPDDGNKYTVNIEKETITTDYSTKTTTSQKTIILKDGEDKDPEVLLKAHGFNSNAWKIKTASNTKMNWTRPSGEAGTSAYFSKIVVEPKETEFIDIIKVISKELEDFVPPMFPKRDSNVTDSSECLVVPLYDLHWGRIEDREDYNGFDIEKEKLRIINHVKKYIDKFNNRKFDRVFLVIGQDFLNSSFTGYTTSQSHLQDNALDFRTMYRTGCELLITIIQMFAECCNDLHVIGSLGNHDTSEEVALFMHMNAYFRNADHIYIDDKTRPRKYIQYGNSCIGIGHADKEKDRIYGLMQCEAPDMWASTKTHVFITGHLHHFEVGSKQGVEVYRVPSICYRDRWTVEQGYVQNEPKTMCFVFDAEEGLTETHFMYL